MSGAVLIVFEAASYFALKILPNIWGIPYDTDDRYYVVCGAFALLIIPAFHLCGVNRITLDMKKLALLSLVVQFLGLIFYWSRIPIEYYNEAIHILLTLQFGRLFIEGVADGVRYDEDGTRNTLLPSNCPCRRAFNFEKKK